MYEKPTVQATRLCSIITNADYTTTATMMIIILMMMMRMPMQRCTLACTYPRTFNKGGLAGRPSRSSIRVNGQKSHAHFMFAKVYTDVVVRVPAQLKLQTSSRRSRRSRRYRHRRRRRHPMFTLYMCAHYTCINLCSPGNGWKRFQLHSPCTCSGWCGKCNSSIGSSSISSSANCKSLSCNERTCKTVCCVAMPPLRMQLQSLCCCSRLHYVHS